MSKPKGLRSVSLPFSLAKSFGKLKQRLKAKSMGVSKVRPIAQNYIGVDFILFDSAVSEIFCFKHDVGASNQSNAIIFIGNADVDSLRAGVEINFFNNLPVGQVISSIYLPEKISTCPKKTKNNKF